MSEPVEVNHPTETPVAPPEAAVHSFEFTGSAAEYFRIWIVNVFLSVITLGIYSAWAKVRNKQYFYRHTYVDGASFEYHGDPWKILTGRILAVAFLALLALSQRYSVVVYLVTIAVVVLTTPWVLVKALGFNARNSSWRNVRFAFKGTTGGAVIAYLKGMAACIGMMGLGFPILQWIVTRFAVENHSFGKLSFRFHTEVGAFFRTYLGAALILVIPVGLLITLLMAASVREADSALTELAIAAVYAGYFATFVFVKACMANLVWGGIAIGDHRLVSSQAFWEVFVLEITNLLAIAGTLGLAAPWAKIRKHRYRVQHLTLHAAGPLVVEADPSHARDGALADAASDLGDFDLGFG